MRLAAELGLAVEEGFYTLYDVYNADEAFLTGRRGRSDLLSRLTSGPSALGFRAAHQGDHRQLPRVRIQHGHTGIYGCVREAHRPDQADEAGEDVLLYDTTLRDGMQREGLSLSVDEKVRIALRIAEMGVHIIEGGFAASNPKDDEFFRRMRTSRWAAPRWRSLGMTRSPGLVAEEDPVWRLCRFLGTGDGRRQDVGSPH